MLGMRCIEHALLAFGRQDCKWLLGHSVFGSILDLFASLIDKHASACGLLPRVRG